MSFNASEYIDELLGQRNYLPPDLQIDDRHIPEAKNAYEFFYSPKFIQNCMPPKGLFVRQLEILTKLYGEYCPRCSDMEYFKNLKVDDTESNFIQKICLLEYGVCPHCGATKSELYNCNELDVHTQEVGLAGQRCVTGDTLLNTTEGLISFKELAESQSKEEGFSKFQGNLKVFTENGGLVTPSHFYRQKGQQVITVELNQGYKITGTPEHPIYTNEGFVKLKDLNLNHCVLLNSGLDIIGKHKERSGHIKKNITFSRFRKKALEKFNSLKKVSKSLSKSIEYKSCDIDEDIAKLIGFWIAEGDKSCLIGNKDEKVLDFCYEQFKRLFNAEPILDKERDFSVGLPWMKANLYWNEIVEGNINGGSANKKIPSYIFKCRKSVICALLQGLFEGDGTVEGLTISYTSISENLINQLQIILLNLGIPTSRRKFKTWATNGTEKQIEKEGWTLYIVGKNSVQKFIEEIDFFSERKKITARNILLNDKSKFEASSYFDCLPATITKEFVEILNKCVDYLKAFPRIKNDGQIHSSYCGMSSLYNNTDFGFRGSEKLTKYKLEQVYENIKKSYGYSLLPMSYKVELFKFYEKYHNKNKHWIEIKNIKWEEEKQEVFDITVPNLHNFYANGFLNHNSGKSALVSMSLSYTNHKFLKVPNLQRTYNLIPTSPFTMPLVAMSQSKAQENLYNALASYFEQGNWFKEYTDFLKEQQDKYNLEIFAIKETYTRWRHKNILVLPLGPDKRKLRGNTSIAGAIDELGWMLAGQEGGIKFDPDEIYASMNNSFMTAKEAYLKLLSQGYSNVPAPILFNISSPSSKKDKICRLYEESKYDRYMYGFHFATWEINPQLPFDGPAMTSERNKDSRKFWRDFGAVPPNSASSFIPDIDLFKPLINKTKQNICKINKVTHFIGGQEFTYGKLVIPREETQKPNRVLAIDAGYKFNSFAFAVAHLETNIISKEKNVVYDALVEIIPADTAPLDYTRIFSDVIVPMIKKLNIRLIAADRWQSIKLLSDVSNDKSLKCKTFTHSLKYQGFMNYKDAIISEAIRFPKPELNWNEIELAGNDSYPYGFEGKPISHFIFQNISVEDKMGKTVAKGEGTTDDIFRAAVLAHHCLTQEEQFKNLFKGSAFGSGSSGRAVAAIPGGTAAGGGSRICATPTGTVNRF